MTKMLALQSVQLVTSMNICKNISEAKTSDFYSPLPMCPFELDLNLT